MEIYEVALFYKIFPGCHVKELTFKNITERKIVHENLGIFDRTAVYTFSYLLPKLLAASGRGLFSSSQTKSLPLLIFLAGSCCLNSVH